MISAQLPVPVAAGHARPLCPVLRWAEREAGLESWLARYGHRGPLESDPLHPRFAELGELLLEDLAQAPKGAAPTAPRTARPFFLLQPLFWMDRLRESFRDELMRAWQSWRVRLLEAADELVERGWLDAREDVFYLGRAELADRQLYRDRAGERRAERERLALLDLPTTTDEATIDGLLAGLGSEAGDPGGASAGRERRSFAGISLGPGCFEGHVTKARHLGDLLAAASSGDVRLDGGTMLVVPALEPSWAVVFGRVGGVVAEIGGELSHSSILLREVGKPALVNCPGVYAGLDQGEKVRIDGAAARLERLSQ